jgi:hypothetical protein
MLGPCELVCLISYYVREFFDKRTQEWLYKINLQVFKTCLNVM